MAWVSGRSCCSSVPIARGGDQLPVLHNSKPGHLQGIGMGARQPRSLSHAALGSVHVPRGSAEFFQGRLFFWESFLYNFSLSSSPCNHAIPLAPL